jgi:hypothetical protein
MIRQLGFRFRDWDTDSAIQIPIPRFRIYFRDSDTDSGIPIPIARF